MCICPEHSSIEQVMEVQTVLAQNLIVSFILWSLLLPRMTANEQLTLREVFIATHPV